MTATVGNPTLENEMVLEIINCRLAETRIARHFIQTLSTDVSENQQAEESITSSQMQR